MRVSKLDESNVVDRAILALGGSVTHAVAKTLIPDRTWRHWRKVGRVTGRDELFTIEDLTGIPARELAGLAIINGGPNGGNELSEQETKKRALLLELHPATHDVAGVSARLTPLRHAA